VAATVGGVYGVTTDDGRAVEATLRGRLKRERRTGDRVVIGDRVTVAEADDGWTVEEVLPRRTQLVRRGPGGRRPQVVVANLDRVLVVVAARDPDVTLTLVDRLLVVAESSGMHAQLVVNKIELDGADAVVRALSDVYRPIGYDPLLVSAADGTGMDRLAEEICTGSSALVGPSGVGKSTLLNAIDPELELLTGALSRKTGRGRHTTVNARLIELACGGLVADTPGFGDVGLWGVPPEEVASCFPEFAEREDGCRFRGCAHLSEPDCAVRAALAEGEIAASRYQSYVTLRGEAA
jgi:ribosome biogenesis GTPase